jgi:hypothetical protein
MLGLYGDPPAAGQMFYGQINELGVKARVNGAGQRFAQLVRQFGPVVRAENVVPRYCRGAPRETGSERFSFFRHGLVIPRRTFPTRKPWMYVPPLALVGALAFSGQNAAMLSAALVLFAIVTLVCFLFWA